MIISSSFLNQPHACLIGVSRHQQVWKIGWTRVPSADGYSREGYKTTLYGSTCNYVRTLHDGRIMGHWAYPAEPEKIKIGHWPMMFHIALQSNLENDPLVQIEENHLRTELVNQLLGVVKYGQLQYKKAIQLTYTFVKDRLTRPEHGLEFLFQTWNK